MIHAKATCEALRLDGGVTMATLSRVAGIGSP